MEKINLVLYGSCQCGAILDILEMVILDFENIFNPVLVTNWKYITSRKPLPTELYNASVFIYQPFKSDNTPQEYLTTTILDKIRRPCKIISFPFFNCNCYFPEYVSGKESTIQPGAPYGLFPLIPKEMQYCRDKQELLNIFKNVNLIDKVTIKENQEQCIQALLRRDAECDIKVETVIKSNYKTKRLFHSIQHPCNFLLVFVASQILELLQQDYPFLKYDLSLLETCPELLKEHVVPILPSVKMRLDLQFDDEQSWFNGKSVSLEEYIDKYVSTVKHT